MNELQVELRSFIEACWTSNNLQEVMEKTGLPLTKVHAMRDVLAKRGVPMKKYPRPSKYAGVNWDELIEFAKTLEQA